MNPVRRTEMPRPSPMRLLFICEAVTLAHTARPLVLAEHAARSGHDVTIAGADRIARSGAYPGLHWRELPGIGSQRFMAALSQGKPVYRYQDLLRYVTDDLELIRSVEPDLIVGDFRLSLSVSARVAGVPCAAISNAYWSPAAPTPMPMPVLPMTRWLPLPLARAIFAAASPLVLPLHCRPLNRLRTEHGMAPVGSDLRKVYTDADHVLYADVPEMFPLQALPQGHRFLGPLLWSPQIDLPEWWSGLPNDKPLAYVTLGSSGSVQTLRSVLTALADSRFSVAASTAGAVAASLPSSPHIRTAAYLPGDATARRATIVVCNGGSMACQQAFVAGRPVLGIASNMDQFLNMSAVTALGAGICLRADRITAPAVRAACDTLLTQASFAQAAARLGEHLRQRDAGTQFDQFLTTLAPS